MRLNIWNQKQRWIRHRSWKAIYKIYWSVGQNINIKKEVILKIAKDIMIAFTRRWSFVLIGRANQFKEMK